MFILQWVDYTIRTFVDMPAQVTLHNIKFELFIAKFMQSQD